MSAGRNAPVSSVTNLRAMSSISAVFVSMCFCRNAFIRPAIFGLVACFVSMSISSRSLTIWFRIIAGVVTSSISPNIPICAPRPISST